MLISISLALMTAFSVIGFTASAYQFDDFLDSDYCGDDLYWDYDSKTKTLTISGTGEMYEQDWPWGDYIPKMENVVIEDGATSLNQDFVCGAQNLKSVSLGNTLKVIGAAAFMNCPSLTEIVIPSSVKTIRASAFYACTSLENITFSDNTDYIGFYALQDTLWYYNQPDGEVYAGNVLYDYKGKRDALTEFTVKDGTLGIGDFALENAKSLKTVTLPESLTTVGNGAFSNCKSLERVNSNAKIMKIGYMAFADCEALSSLDLGGEVKYIDFMAFSNCRSLKSIDLGDNVAFVGANAFNNCAWYNELSDGAIYIGKCLYTNKGTCTDTEFTVKDGTKTISAYALFNQKSVKKVTLPEGVTEIGEMAFVNTSLAEIYIPDSVENINDAAFSGNKKLIISVNDEYSYGYDYADYYGYNLRIANYTPGDVSYNGKVNTVDVLFLRKYIAGYDQPIEVNAADTNNDGKINTKDVLNLRKHLAGYKNKLK